MLSVPFLEDLMRRWFKPQTFDDPIDRLNYFLTASILAFFAIMVSAKQYVGTPIQCWVPMEFKGGWEEYAEDYCFIQNTFFVPFEKQIPDNFDDRQEAEIGYYQWVPIVLALQAVMFFLPNWIWKRLHCQSGIDLDTVVSEARALRGCRPSVREQDCIKLKEYISDCLGVNDNYRPIRIGCIRLGKNLGSYVTVLYLLVKLLYLINICIQFYILNGFLGSNYTLWGFDAMKDLIYGLEWKDSAVFPRVTLCDFKVRRLANIHRYTVQCVLMINMFNEKIYLFIWFWFLFVAVSTILNFLYCCFQFIPAYSRENSVKTLLKHLVSPTNHIEFKKSIRYFTHDALKPDGCLILRFLEGHAGAIVAREIAHKLYEDYITNQAARLRSVGCDHEYSDPPMLRKGTENSKMEPSNYPYDDRKLVEPLMQLDYGFQDPSKPKDI
ncbi:Innexin family-containing protein [Strongyloides ratti]|uniref:Innexin n=1 Tax=Strongyloides ratti TaxID=34506 RepID=A0A090N0U9_STRRB|nr:Innexin family-containing protein [Strongyloides ratti]CEF71318.1 Innexin family-containing protein [Strongyloides ratti]